MTILRPFKAVRPAKGFESKVISEVQGNVDKFIADGTLMIESKPMLYIYRQTFNGEVQTGYIGSVATENTRKMHNSGKFVDEPVLLSYDDNKKIGALTESYINNHEKEYDITIGDVRHEIWAITDDNVIYGICGLFATISGFRVVEGKELAEAGGTYVAIVFPDEEEWKFKPELIKGFFLHM